MSGFQINDKVVCVDAVPGAGFWNGDYEYPDGYVIKDQIYVIREISTAEFEECAQFLYLHLVGKRVIALRNFTDARVGDECGWWHCRFRKLADIQQENCLKRKNKKSHERKISV